jgi:hypothetical protein
MQQDQTIEIVENTYAEDEGEFSFEIEELDSQHAAMMLLTLEPPLNHSNF